MQIASPVGGHEVDTASIGGLISGPETGPYGATKHAVVGLSKSLPAELAMKKANVGVTIACPGGRYADRRSAVRPPRGRTRETIAGRIQRLDIGESGRIRDPLARPTRRPTGARLEERFTVRRLGVSDRLAKTLTSTKPIESMISVGKTTARNVKRWRDGTMVKRWVAAGMLNAERGFRRVRGCRDMPTLVAVLQGHIETVTSPCDNQDVAQQQIGPSPNFNSDRDILTR